ncbi:rod shape-determining protein MreC [bacterium]|nr:MAG: rod shape-determining protein MreC [bacterium]
MFKYSRKNLTNLIISVLLLLVISFLIPVFRKSTLDILRAPFAIFTSIRQEAGGLIFYHRNMYENRRFRDEINLLRRKIMDTGELSVENLRLKKLLSFKQNTPYKVIAARVIGRDPSNWDSVLIIDKGSQNGIKKGFVSITFLGLAGRVLEAGETTSKIILINDPNLSISALVQRSRQEGLVMGSLGGNLVMKYLPKDSDIKVSDTVITSGFTGNYPKGLIIGTVIEVGVEFSWLTRYALIKPVVNLANLEEVLVIIP